ncbi:MAG: phosphoribosylaminoimidazolesuccinocarboxamide synthase [Halodesulfurarchaeum sp.]
MTSVKEFRVDTEATESDLGTGAFVFTDDYSVFDWGKMPDTIPRKGASLCSMGADNFERLEDDGIPTHYRGVLEDGLLMSMDDVEEPPTEMAIELTQVPDLPYRDGEYDYEAYHREAEQNYLVPLEIVYRNVVPIGSSLRKRYEPTDFDLGVEEWPDDPVSLPDPVVEFSTKYEEQDRYLDRERADEIAGKASIDELESLARDVNRVVTERADEVGLTHQDGKIEVLYHQGTVKVADVVGTFDENRFSADGQQLSKEVVRQFYKESDPEWVEAVEEAKLEANVEGVADWRTLCSVTPKPLPDHVITAVSQMYAAGANTYTGRDVFDVPPLEDVLGKIRNL